jgi:phosphoserine phosphatase
MAKMNHRATKSRPANRLAALAARDVVNAHYEKIGRREPVSEAELRAFMTAAATLVVTRDEKVLAEIAAHVLNLSLLEYQRQIEAAAAAPKKD